MTTVTWGGFVWGDGTTWGKARPVPVFGGVLVTLGTDPLAVAVTLGTDTIAVQVVPGTDPLAVSVTPGTDPIAVQVTSGDT